MLRPWRLYRVTRSSDHDLKPQYNVDALKKPIVPPVRVKTPIAPFEWFPRAFWIALMKKPMPAPWAPAIPAVLRTEVGPWASGAPAVERGKGNMAFQRRELDWRKLGQPDSGLVGEPIAFLGSAPSALHELRRRTLVSTA